MMIRRATEEDAQSVLQMAKRLFEDLHHHLILSDEEYLSFCQSILKRGDYIVFISETPEGNATGVLTMTERRSIYDIFFQCCRTAPLSLGVRLSFRGYLSTWSWMNFIRVFYW